MEEPAGESGSPLQQERIKVHLLSLCQLGPLGFSLSDLAFARDLRSELAEAKRAPVNMEHQKQTKRISSRLRVQH